MKRLMIILTTTCAMLLPHAALADDTTEDNQQDGAVVSQAKTLFTEMQRLGINYSFSYTSEVFGKVRGGISERNAVRHRNDLSGYLSWDSQQAGMWQGGTAFMHAQSQGGRGISGDLIGDFQAISNIDAHDFSQISELWYQQDFNDGALWFRFGKQETNEYFAAPAFGGEFLNGSAGFAPTIPIITYPYTDWAATVGVQPADWLSAIYSIGRGRGSCDIDGPCGTMQILQVTLHHNPWKHPGHFAFAMWHSSADFEVFESGEIIDSTVGYYMTWDQMLWLADTADPEGTGLGVFLQHGWAPEDRIEADFFWGGGLQYTGINPLRPADAMGLGIFRVHFSPEAGFDMPQETAIEAFYSFTLFERLNLKPDVQYVINPGGLDVDPALAVGIRITFTLQ